MVYENKPEMFTGVKNNAENIKNRVNADGSLAFDPIEGMPFEKMQKLRDQFPKTAGNIIVAVSDEHLRALLASNDIDYVIPYHLLGLNENLRLMMSIEDRVDYTRTQGEKSNGAEKVNGVKMWHKAPKFSEWFDADAAAKAVDGYAFMREAAQKYLTLCEERGLAPKRYGSTCFRSFLTISAPFRSETDAFRLFFLHCFRVLRACLWDKLWSSKTPRMQRSPHPRCFHFSIISNSSGGYK